MALESRLFKLQDKEYADFQSKLTPGISRERFIGIRMPVLRKFARAFERESAAAVGSFLAALPHYYYDENVLHGLLLSDMKDFDGCIAALDTFLPYVDNWAVCDCMAPKSFGRHREELLPKIREWTSSSCVYTCRFGMGMLMRHFLDGDFRPEYLEIPAAVRSEEYYVNMMTAWFFATALAKQWDASILYLEENLLDTWVHNRTIQKARESFRITPEQKEYLKTLKRR